MQHAEAVLQQPLAQPGQRIGLHGLQWLGERLATLGYGPSIRTNRRTPSGLAVVEECEDAYLLRRSWLEQRWRRQRMLERAARRLQA